MEVHYTSAYVILLTKEGVRQAVGGSTLLPSPANHGPAAASRAQTRGTDREGYADLAFGGATSETEVLLPMRQPGLVKALVPPCGVHGDEGILILSGDMVKAEPPAGECTLADVAPTALHLLGLPVPSYMDGRVLIEHLCGDAAARPVEVIGEPLPAPEVRDVSTTLEDEEALTERLRALGYL